ncbi:MAG TPA: hypothetical protein P5048_04165 [Chlamydiales bacterium]|nr:hypothetical protein [Chlamydiales bacterium]
MKKILLFLVIFLALIIFFLPSFFNTSYGKNILLSMVEKKTNSSIQIEKFHLSWTGPQSFINVQIDHKNFDFNAKSLLIENPLIKTITADNLQKSLLLKMSLENGSFISKHPNFPTVKIDQMQAKVSQKDKTIQSSFQGNTKIHQTKGSFDFSYIQKDKTQSFSFEGKKLPTNLFDLLLKKQLSNSTILMEDLLGTIISDLEINLTMDDKKAPLSVNVTSNNVLINAKGQIDQNNFSLTSPASIRITPSNDFIKKVLVPINSHLEDIIRFQNPVYLTIYDLKAPLSNHFLEKMEIKRGILEIGKVDVSIDPFINALLTFLQQAPLSNTTVWVAPFDFNIDHSKISIKRADILIDKMIHICTWGNIDKESQKLDMKLAILSSTLNNLFGMKLPPSVSLQIPIKGTYKEPKASIKKASKTLGTLLAMQALGQDSLINKIVSQIIIENEKSPLPAQKRKLPWE